MAAFFSKYGFIIWIILILAFCIGFHFLLRRVLVPKFKKMQNIIGPFLIEFVEAGVWFAAVILICNLIPNLSQFTQSIIASSGIAAIVIGLAAQESLANIMAGIFITIFKPFVIGDRIHIVGDETSGFVKSISLRHTVIHTFTNVDVIVPNSIMGSSKIENSTYTVGTGYPIEVTIAYEGKEKRERALEIMEEVITSHPSFYDMRTPEQVEQGEKPSRALLVSYEDSGIKLKIIMYTKTFQESIVACSECRMKILDEFEKAGIEIPYNKLVVMKKKIS